jgi:hypothetical protein
VKRQPIRSEFSKSCHGDSRNCETLSGRKSSSCGPSTTRSSHGGSRPGLSGSAMLRPSSASSGRRDSPVASTSPRSSLRPPRPPIRARTFVDRLPSASGTSIPPASATYARAPRRGSPNASTAPTSTGTASYMGTGRPFTDAERSAPVIAITVGRRNRSFGPSRRISRPASPGSSPTRKASPTLFPTSRLACCSASVSNAPEGGMPVARRPPRPRSWTVVCMPPSMTSTHPVTAHLHGRRGRATRGSPSG